MAMALPPLLVCCLMLFAVLICYNWLASTGLFGSPDMLSQRRVLAYLPVTHEQVHYDEQLDSLLSMFNADILMSTATNLLSLKGEVYRVTSVEGQGQINVSTLAVGKLGKSCSSLLDNPVDELIIAQNGILSFDGLSSSWIEPGKVVQMAASGNADYNPYFNPKNKILIVFTTCNQLQMTILSLQYMKVPDQIADLVIVDDHSTDGTVEYLQRKGFAVISKDKATGLTDSWNIGYRLAVTLGYPHIILMNNDVLLTSGSIRLMHLSLKQHALVAPLTTAKGAGHNPSQSVNKALGLKGSMGGFVDDYRNADAIQSTLERKYSSYNQSNDHFSCTSVPSEYRGQSKFNGFCFGINIAKIAPAVFSPGVELFDPHDVIVGQEDHLIERMRKANLAPVVLYCVFLYHFKSVTVSAASTEVMTAIMKQHNVQVSSSGTGPMVKLQFQNKANQTVTKAVDIREDLRWYHPESSDAAFAEGVKSSKGTQQDHAGMSKQSCVGDLAFPVGINWNESSMRSGTQQRFGDSIANDFCVYPSFWSKQCSDAEDVDGQPQTDDAADVLVIAIATSDPVKTPAAGDIFTAYEVAQALQNKYSNIQIRYLRRGSQWYAPQHLYDVDVLITLLDAYDLSKILPLYQSSSKPASFNQLLPVDLRLKPHFITIAWMRNWFNRWLSRPWIGNYDLILTSSSLSKNFLDRIGQEIGFPVKCTMRCPRSNPYSHLFNTRRLVPTYVYPLATSVHEQGGAASNSSNSIARRTPHRYIRVATMAAASMGSMTMGSMGYVNNKQNFDLIAWTAQVFGGVHYIFTGSYYGQRRNIMSFDPSLIPMWKGRVVGEGWATAPNMSSWADISVGRLPYEVVKEAYKSVKLVVDDANHVTNPWGSVNSRVFDALAAGALVITNGALGVHELFGEALEAAGLPLPVYTSGSDLADMIDYYLRNEEMRVRLVEVMRSVVVQQHSYSLRAVQLSEMLSSSFGLQLMPKGDATVVSTNRQLARVSREQEDEEDTDPLEVMLFVQANESTSASAVDGSMVQSPEAFLLQAGADLLSPTNDSDDSPLAASFNGSEGRSSLCIGVRTMHSQEDWLAIFVRSLLVQYRKSEYNSKIDMHILLVDTEANSTFQRSLLALTDRLNQPFPSPVVDVLAFSPSPSNDPTSHNPFYGYDATDRMLHFMLTRHQLHASKALDRSSKAAAAAGTSRRSHRSKSSMHTAAAPSAASPCEWLMFTNGDNMYNAAWFDKVAPAMLEPGLDMVGWDFVTHHPRGPTKDTPNLPITMEMKRGYLDLASVMMRSSLFVQTGTRFLADSVLTKDLFARDFFTITRLLGAVRAQGIYLIHQCLLFHQ